MSLATHIKPISYLKADAAKIAAELKNDGEAYMISQNEKDIKQGKVHDAKTVLAQLRTRRGL